jgi:hypothetical protein
MDESIRHDGNWRHMSVRAQEEVRTYRLYDELTEIEEEIHAKERIDGIVRAVRLIETWT